MDNLDLLHYIEQARKSGMGDDQLRQGLLQGGWQESIVDEALKSSPPQADSLIPKAPLFSKSVVLITTIAGIAILSYFASAYYLKLSPFDQAVAPIPTFTLRPAHSTSSGQLDATSSWKTYRNEEYGFEFKYPEDWDKYTVKLDNSDQSVVATYKFCLPTTDEYYKNYADKTNCDNNAFRYAPVLAITIFSHSQWKENQQSDINKSVYAGENIKYVAGFTQAQEPTPDLSNQFNEINQILSTFRFLK